jgi:hypothetical protein
MDQKKAAKLAPLSETVMAPDATNPASTILELDELWSNAREEDEPGLDLDRFVPREPSSGRLCDRRPKPKYLSSFVGGYSTSKLMQGTVSRISGVPIRR